MLAAGSLEARLSPEPISSSILGPSIGQDNLVRGLEAVAISVAVVALIMVLYYFGAGLVADLTLLINAVMIFGIMAMIDGTFTLPGLAGIALTIGMAVDANVLIFERIREELVNHGEDLRTSIRLGFSKAASAILDGNITNLIVCFILYQTAATEVKGFALTLSIGVLATLSGIAMAFRAITAYSIASRGPLSCSICIAWRGGPRRAPTKRWGPSPGVACTSIAGPQTARRSPPDVPGLN